MSWAYVILAAVVSTGVSFAGFSWVTRGQKPSDQMTAEELSRERDRAKRISSNWGAIALYLIQIGSGLVAVIPSIALLGWIGQGFQTSPDLETIAWLTGMFVIGWPVFGWCVRLTDALSDKKSGAIS